MTQHLTTTEFTGEAIADDHLANAHLDRAWLAAQVRGMIEDAEEEIDPDESLIFYGLDSIAVMRFAAELKTYGIEVPFEALAAAPSLTNWWTLIEAHRAG
ncbi:phosphopantetheine-binding protein [Albirhodobacter sp. R86504]|uniref:phosphopantetheine-binding protein n=1 Tax=Albirhodobacter sp. R86504 TaxID=3093848 RepID=UPI00367211F6